MDNTKKLFFESFLLIAMLWSFLIKSIRNTHHFVFFNRDRDRISDPIFLKTKSFIGAQIKYTWRELEPSKDLYDFSMVAQDLAFLNSKGKKLFIQLQDVSFDDSIINVPEYLLSKEYNGGIARQYCITEDENNAVPEGWVARRWDISVQERFYKLLFALAKEFDGNIEGINLPETSIEFGKSGKLFPEGFTFEIYRDAVIKNMTILRQTFTKSIVMQYANFMPGEWLPDLDKFYLRDIYRTAKE